MSYILDALKKAEAERDQGPIPNIHSVSGPTDLDLEPTVRAAQPWPLILGVLMVVLALGALWWWQQTASVTTSAPAVTNAELNHTSIMVAQTEPPMTQAAVPAPVPVQMTPAVPVPQPPLPKATTPKPSVEPMPQSVMPAAIQPVVNVPPVVAQPKMTAPSGPPVVQIDPAARTKPKPRVLMLAELPEDVRRQLPQVAVSGAMYSEQPSSRMVLINNRVFHEGDEPIAGLILEEIRLKSAVLNFKGTRYAVSY